MPLPNKRVVTGILGAVVLAAGAVASKWEGYEPTAFVDRIGTGRPATACRGHTGADVVVGRTYSKEQCDKWFSDDLTAAANGVKACVKYPISVPEWAAYTSVAYNTGIGTFCKSSIARKANAGDRAGACKAIELYVYSGGVKRQGLVNRRADERKLCEGRV